MDSAEVKKADIEQIAKVTADMVMQRIAMSKREGHFARENYQDESFFLAVNEGYIHHISRHDPCHVEMDFTSVEEAKAKGYFHFYFGPNHVGEMHVTSPEIADILRKIPPALGR